MVMAQRICPNCGSDDVEPYTRYPLQILEDWFPNSWECNNCGYTGFMPVTDESSITENQETGSTETALDDAHLPFKHWGTTHYRIAVIAVVVFTIYLLMRPYL